jgi:hypothetical protein
MSPAVVCRHAQDPPRSRTTTRVPALTIHRTTADAARRAENGLVGPDAVGLPSCLEQWHSGGSGLPPFGCSLLTCFRLKPVPA